MNKNILLCLMFGVLLISVVSASCPPHKQTTDFSAVAISNNATACNVSYIQYPDNSILYINGEMEKNDNSFNYTISFGNFTRIGETYVGIKCTDGLTEEVGTICRNVTPSGFTNTLGFYFIMLSISAGLVFMGFKIEDNWVIVLGGFAIVFVGLFVLFYGIDIIKDTIYTWAMGIIILMTGAYFSVRGAMEALYA